MLTPSFGFAYDEEAKKCVLDFSSADLVPELATTDQEDGTKTETAKGFTITYTSYEKCKEGDDAPYYKIIVQGVCNTNADEAKPLTAIEEGTDECTSAFKVVDPSVCAQEMDLWAAI